MTGSLVPVNHYLDNVASHLEGTVLHAVWRWWVEVITLMLPLKCMMWLTKHRCEITIRWEDNKLYCHRKQGEQYHQLSDLHFEQISQQEFSIVDQLASQCDMPLDSTDVNITLLLEQPQVLSISLVLPTAAQDDMRQVLNFEMDRLTPAKAEVFYFDYIVTKSANNSNTVDVELYVIKREVLDQILNRLTACNVPIQHVDVASDNTDSGSSLNPKQIDLLPAKKRACKNVWLSLGATILAFSMMYFITDYALLLKWQRIEKYQSTIGELKGETQAYSDFYNQLEQFSASTNFLVNMKRETPVISEVLFRLTELLPKHTFINQMYVKNGEVEIQGLSEQAAKLIPQLEASLWFDQVVLRAPITIETNSKKEKFKIRFTVAVDQFRQETTAPLASVNNAANQKLANKLGGNDG